MRNIFLTVLSALLLLLSPVVCAGEGVDDVVKMSNAGITEDVLLAFVQDSKLSYDDLSAADIETLQNNGIPSTVIVAMIDHGKTQADAAPAETITAADTSAIVVAPAPNEANISYFYEALAPDGRWQQVDGVGWAWQPRVAVQTEWRPYCNDGHWVWTDAGWFFESDYRWSWAAFHYGRWHHHDRIGWVWVPGTEWAPAWVSWRESGSHFGWAPLPPESHFDAKVGFSFHDKHVGFNFDFGLSDRDYTFVPSDRFLDANLSIVAIAPARNRDVFKETTIVNNTYVYNDNRIINNGISVRQVQERTQRKVEAVAITDANIKAGEPVRGEVRAKNAIAVYRPKIEKAAPKDPPAAIAKATHVKRDAKAARPINTTSRDEAKTRVTEELAKRRSAAPKAPANEPAKAKADEAAQRRLDAEVKQRESRENRQETKQQETQTREKNRDEAAKAQAERQAKLDAEKNTREQAREQNRDETAKAQAERQAKLDGEKNAREQAREQNRDEAAKAQADRQAKLDAEKNARQQAKQDAAQQREQDKEKAAPAPKPEAAPRATVPPKGDAGPHVEERAQQRAERAQERDEKRDEQNAKREERKANRDEQKQ